MERIKKRPLYSRINGIYYPSMFASQQFKEALEYKARPDDVFIVTYPKCGTTWMQRILLYIFRKGKQVEDVLSLPVLCPFIDMTGLESVNRMPRPGAIKTHLPYTHLPFHSQAKYIFVARNPKDCCVSFYHHARGHPGFGFLDGEFDDFFEVFMAGEVEYGDYFDHILSWYPHRNDQNVFYTTFEDMKRNLADVVLRLVKFLGKDYAGGIERDNTVLRNILHFSSFDYMKTKMSTLYDLQRRKREAEKGDALLGLKHMAEFTSALNPPSLPTQRDFIRKGIVGDWKNHLSDEQNERLTKRFFERTNGTEIQDWYADIFNVG